jgi:hypothetical protein
MLPRYDMCVAYINESGQLSIFDAVLEDEYAFREVDRLQSLVCNPTPKESTEVVLLLHSRRREETLFHPADSSSAIQSSP